MTVLGLQRVDRENTDCFSAQNYNVKRFISTLSVLRFCASIGRRDDVETFRFPIFIAGTRKFGTS